MNREKINSSTDDDDERVFPHKIFPKAYAIAGDVVVRL